MVSLVNIYAQKCDQDDENWLFSLANRHGLHVSREGCPGLSEVFLSYDESCLSLSRQQHRAPAPTLVDFGAAALTWRRNTSGKAQGIGQAVGLKKLANPWVLDATAGLGRDGFILASLGCRVTLVERSPILAALLEDGFRRGRCSGDQHLSAILERMELLTGDARDHLHALHGRGEPRPDVIYLDPMFPARNKSAMVKKDMALLQALLPVDDNLDELLELAIQVAKHRVVVKRPGARTSDKERRPAFQVPGKSCHFDVYLPVEKGSAQ